MVDNDARIAALESRIVALETTACGCLDCQALRRRRIAETAILQQLAIERAPDAIAQVRKMSPRDQAMFWKAAADERAIELLTGPDVTDEERDAWIGFKLSVRDRIELELVELPARVRVRLVAQNMRYTPSHLIVDDDTANKLRGAGLGARLVRKHDDVTEYVGLQVAKDLAPIVERRQLEAMTKIDKGLRDSIAAGEMVVEQLSEQENKAIEAQLWHDLDSYSRPKRPRKKVAPLKLDANADEPDSP